MKKRGVSLSTRKGCKSASKRRGQALVINNRTVVAKVFDSRLREFCSQSGYSGAEVFPLSFPYYDLM